MAAARQQAAWLRTAALLALTANCHRDPRRRPYSPADFLPTPAAAVPPPRADLAVLKAVFIDRHHPEHRP